MAKALVLRSLAAASVVAVLARLPPLASSSARLRAALVLLGAYLPGLLDGAEYKAAPRRSAHVTAAVRAACKSLLSRVFNIKNTVIEDPEKLAECKQYIIAVHPHGVLSLDHFLTIAGYSPSLEQIAPQECRSALSAGAVFKIPVLRELLLGLGCVDAGRKTADLCLERGLSLSVVPGGEREQLIAQRGPVEKVVLQERKGFVRLALRHGVPLVPAYCFGELQMYRQSSLLFGLRSWVQRKLGIALVLPFGPYGLPCVPFPDPICLVVGAPMQMPHIPSPSDDELKRHHSRYMAELESLFHRHKSAAGYEKMELEMI